MTRRKGFAVFLAAMLAVPLLMIGVNELALATGKRVLLQVRPVDPDDPFRGEYVALSYDISRATVESGVEVGDRVYVPLYRQGRIWRGIDGVRARPEGGTFIRGTRSGVGIVFGIETFYVEEGKAIEYERAISRRALYAEVVLDDDGKARLDDLVVIEP